MLFELMTSRYPGMRRWLTQRLCALSMAVILLLFWGRLAWLQPYDFASWHMVFAPLWWRVLTVWFFICMLMHAWLGVHDVLKDYVPHARLRAGMQWLVDAMVAGNLLAVLWILFGLDF